MKNPSKLTATGILGIIAGIAVLGVVLLTLGFSAGCIGGGVTGSTNLESKIFNYSDFTKVEAHNGFQLEMTKSSTFSIKITADDNVHEYINVTKTGETLEIGLDWGRNYHSVTLKAEINMPNLYKLDLSGGSQASITGFSSSHDLSVGLSGGSGVSGNITAADAKFDLSGGSRVNLHGSADDLDISGSGGSQLNLETFSVNNADVNLSGGSGATVQVSNTLDVNLSGGSRVTYIGEPTLGNIKLSGDSTVSKK